MITSDRHPNFRHLLVDTNGLVLGVHVHAANRHDRDGAQRLLADRLKEELPRLAMVWADAAYMGRFREWMRNERGWRLEVPRHPDRQLWRYGLEEKPRGFQVLPPPCEFKNAKQPELRFHAVLTDETREVRFERLAMG